MSNLPGISLRRERKKPEINVSPLVDMVFLLLIFFLVTTNFSRETGVDVRKPKAQSAQSLSRESILVAITREGNIHINDHKVDKKTLQRIIKETLSKTPDSSIIIVADNESLTGKMIEVMDACKLAGAEKISVSALKEEE